MKNLKHIVSNFVQDESGQDLIEYALIAALIGLVAALALPALTTAITGVFTRISTALAAA